MKKMLTFIIIGLLMMILVACKSNESNDSSIHKQMDNSKGTISYTNVEKSKLEEYYDDDYWVFILYVDEKNGISRKQIYDKFLNSKFDENSYLGCGLIVGTAKEILDLKPVEGLDITLTEYVNEYYIVDEAYIDKFEAEKDTVYVHLNDVKPSEADFILDNYDVVEISEDYFYGNDKEVYVCVNVTKDELKQLYNDERVAGMRKRMEIDEGKQVDCLNGRIDNYPFDWPEK